MTAIPCPNCGRTNPDDARFCAYCAGPLPTAEAPDVRKLVTLVFSDLKGSTKLGEELDPEAIRGVMSRYFDAMRRVIERHGGTVEKFVGDAVMAAFGIPVIREDDALRAVRAALEMQAEQARLNEEFERRFGAAIEVRTGVNTGRVIAGDPSQGQSFATGDAVNVAARLEQAAPTGEILVGEPTYELVRDAVKVEPVEPLSLKGKSEPLPAYRLLGLESEPPSLTTRLDAPLIGRDAELAQLLEAFSRAERTGSQEIALVVGDAGVGKSRLAAEFLEQVRARATVVAGRCLHYGEGITFWPIAEIVREAAGLEDSDSPAAALDKLGALYGEGDEARPRTTALGTAIGLTQAELVIGDVFLAIRTLFQTLAQEQPLVVVLDDLHWGEEALFDMVEYLGRTGQSGPVLLLGLARGDLLEQRPEWARSFSRLELTPLSASESYRLASELLGAPMDHALLGRLNEAAQGNPLFVGELVRMMVEEGELRRENGNWVPTRDLADVTAPQTLEGLLSARLERLIPAQRSVLEGASVVGQVFWPGAVEELMDERDGVEDSLGRLVRAQLVLPDPGRFAGEEAFRFAHLMVRDAAYARLLKATRATYHERFAHWLEKHAGERRGEYEEIVGYHLEQAHRYLTELGPADAKARALAEEAAERLASAGRRAYDREDVTAAVELLDRSASLLDQDAPGRFDVLLPLGSALTQGGELERADAVLTEAGEAARRQGDPHPELRARVERGLARALIDPVRSKAEVARLAEEAIQVFGTSGDEVGLVRALLLGAQADGERLRWGEAEAKLLRAFEHAKRVGARRDANEIALWMATALYFGPIPTGEAIARIEAFLADIERQWGPASNPQTWWLAVLRAMRGEFDEARALCARTRRAYEQLGHGLSAAGLCQASGMIELLAGEPARAEAELRRGYEKLDAMGERGYLATVAHMLARALLAQGRWEEARPFTEQAEEFAAESDLDAQIGWRRTRAGVLVHLGELNDARTLAEEAVRLALATDDPNEQADTLMALAEVLERSDERASAADTVREALGRYEAKENLVSARRARERHSELGL